MSAWWATRWAVLCGAAAGERGGNGGRFLEPGGGRRRCAPACAASARLYGNVARFRLAAPAPRRCAGTRGCHLTGPHAPPAPPRRRSASGGSPSCGRHPAARQRCASRRAAPFALLPPVGSQPPPGGARPPLGRCPPSTACTARHACAWGNCGAGAPAPPPFCPALTLRAAGAGAPEGATKATQPSSFSLRNLARKGGDHASLLRHVREDIPGAAPALPRAPKSRPSRSMRGTSCAHPQRCWRARGPRPGQAGLQAAPPRARKPPRGSDECLDPSGVSVCLAWATGNALPFPWPCVQLSIRTASSYQCPQRSRARMCVTNAFAHALQASRFPQCRQACCLRQYPGTRRSTSCTV